MSFYNAQTFELRLHVTTRVFLFEQDFIFTTRFDPFYAYLRFKIWNILRITLRTLFGRKFERDIGESNN